MESGLVSYLAWWGPYLVGILAIVYSVILKAGRRVDEEAPRGGAVVPLAIIGILLIAGLVLTGIYAQNWGYGIVLLIGGISALGAMLYSRWHAGSDAARPADTYFGIGLALLELAIIRNVFQSAPVEYLLVTALGAWFVASILYYGRPGMGWIGPRSYALACTVIAGASAMGAYRYTKTGVGSFFVIDMCALVLLLALVGSLIAAWGRVNAIRKIAGGVVFALAVWWLGRLLSDLVLNETDAGLCVLAGAVTVLVVFILNSASRGPRGLLGAMEAGVLAVLAAVACAAVTLRWLEGYGIALASVGALATLPFVYLLSGSSDQTEPEAEIAGGGLGIVAALTALAFVRVFAEATAGSGAAIRLFQSYILTGLILGGVLMMLQAALAGSGSAKTPLGQTLRGLGIVIFGAVIVFAAAYFWRQDAISGLIIGAAVALFMLIVAAPFLGKQAGAPDLAVGLPMFAAVLTPAFLSATLDLTREHKIMVMIWTLATVAFLVIATSALRWRGAR